MGNLLGKHAGGPQISSKDKAILELKVQRDKLKQYEKKASHCVILQAVLDRELAIAKEQLLKNNHHAARLALAKKKYQERLLTQLATQLMTLEQLTLSIEYAMVEQQVVDGLRLGTNVLQQLNRETKIEDVERLMDDTADAIAYQNEIASAMGSTLSEEDEADIMAQLDALVEQEANEQIIDMMPSVPKTALVTDHATNERLEYEHESAAQKTKAKAQKTNAKSARMEDPVAA
eukprot:jgi/Hompol1/2574/HPOL_006055-RA